jgi:type II restriction enzyme
VIERRRPLAEHARRAGWVGCNIRLDRIPLDGEIPLIEKGIAEEKVVVRRRFQRFLPLEHLSSDQRGWSTLTLAVIRELGKSEFSLSDLYEYEQRFAETYPRNRHIRPKIRQQLQVLRDLGVVSFEGSGRYALVT